MGEGGGVGWLAGDIGSGVFTCFIPYDFIVAIFCLFWCMEEEFGARLDG